MNEREDMRLASLSRIVKRGGGKLEQRPRKLDLPRCGARCRSKGGLPCVAPVVVRRDADGRVALAKRCRMHGGLSRGPKTSAGRRRCAEAGRWGAAKRWKRWRAEHPDAPPPRRRKPPRGSRSAARAKAWAQTRRAGETLRAVRRGEPITQIAIDGAMRLLHDMVTENAKAHTDPRSRRALGIVISAATVSLAACRMTAEAPAKCGEVGEGPSNVATMARAQGLRSHDASRTGHAPTGV
jgi:hypothetical protein